jgi:glutamate racemase
VIVSKKPIGMFDSGIGGLTVLHEVEKKLPFEKIIYFGDTARHPYGEKSPESILRYSIENAIYLMDHNIKMLIIACNTASAVSVEKLQKIFNIPVLGVIGPGAEKAVQVSKHGRIAVLATKATIQSGSYQMQIRRLLPSAEVIAIPCPLLAQLIEEGMQEHLATKLILQEYLKPLAKSHVDTILLGCTHYPSLKALIREEVGDQIEIVDSATTLADKAAKILSLNALEATEKTLISHQYFVSENPEKFRQSGERFLSRSIPKVDLQSLPKFAEDAK